MHPWCNGQAHRAFTPRRKGSNPLGCTKVVDASSILAQRDLVSSRRAEPSCARKKHIAGSLTLAQVGRAPHISKGKHMSNIGLGTSAPSAKLDVRGSKEVTTISSVEDLAYYFGAYKIAPAPLSFDLTFRFTASVPNWLVWNDRVVRNDEAVNSEIADEDETLVEFIAKNAKK